jgi:hypothetical protein
MDVPIIIFLIPYVLKIEVQLSVEKPKISSKKYETSGYIKFSLLKKELILLPGKEMFDN